MLSLTTRILVLILLLGGMTLLLAGLTLTSPALAEDPPPPSSARRDILLFEADIALRQRDFSTAVETLETLLQGNPNDEEVMERLAETLQAWGETGGADPDSLRDVTLNLYRRLLEDDPRQPRALASVRRLAPEEWRRYMERAATAESGGQDRVAENYLRIAFELSDTSAVLRDRLGTLTQRLVNAGPEPERTFYLGRLDLAEGRPFEAAARFRQCLDADSTMTAFRKYYGIALYHQEEVSDALSWLQPLEEVDPSDTDIRFYIGSLLFDLRHWQPALEKLLPVAEQHLYRGEAARMVGLALAQAGVHDEISLKYLEMAREDGSLNPDLPCQIGEYFVRLRRWDEARKNFESCQSTNPANPAANLGLGLVADEQGRWQESLDHFEDFLSTHPNSPAVLIRVGVGWLRLEQPDSAAARFRAAILADSAFVSLPADSIGPAELFEVAFLILMVSREYRDGIVVGEHLLASNPTSATYMNNLAMVYADAGENLDRGLDLATKANAASTDNPGFLDTLGWVQVRMKRYRDAEATLNSSLELAAQQGLRDVAEIRYHRAVLYASISQRTKAIEELNQTIEAMKQAPGEVGNPQVRRSAEALLNRLIEEQKRID